MIQNKKILNDLVIMAKVAKDNFPPDALLLDPSQVEKYIASKTCSTCKQFIHYHKVCRGGVVFYGKKKLPESFGCNMWEYF